MKPWGAALTNAVPAGINKMQAATRDLAIDDIGAKTRLDSFHNHVLV